MEVLLYIVIGLQVLMGAFMTWALTRMDASLFEIEARSVANTIVLASINNMMYREMFEEEDDATQNDLMEAPTRTH